MDQLISERASSGAIPGTTARRLYDPRLDGLKGLAVLALATTHVMAFLSLDDTDPVDHPILMALINGANAVLHNSAAVILAFVLTGYLFAISLRREQSTLTFLLRRAMYILPALWVAVLFAFAIFKFIRPTIGFPDPTEFFLAASRVPGLWELGLNLAPYAGRVILPTWAIIPLLTGSVVVLVFAVVSRWVGAMGQLALFAVTVWLTFVAGRQLTSILYLFCFLAGGWLVADVVAPAIKHRALAHGVALVGLMMVCCDVDYLPTTGLLTMRLWYTIGAVLLVGAITSQPEPWTWLASPPLRRVGQISYSFFLIHLPVIYAVSVAMYASPIPFGSGVVGNFQIFAIGMPVSYLAAQVLHACVERPSIDLGRNAAPYVRGLWAKRGDYQDMVNSSENPM